MKAVSPWDIGKALCPHTTQDTPPPRATQTARGLTLTVTCDNASQFTRLLTLNRIGDFPVTVTPVARRIQAVIWATELDEIEVPILEEGFATQGVCAVYRNPRGPKARLILTFMRDRLPDRVYAGYLSYKPQHNIPRPRRCENCHRYGHGAAKCRSRARCGRCSGDHASTGCHATPQCCACQGEHCVDDPNCPMWIRERKIQELIACDDMTPADAREAATELGYYVTPPQRSAPRRRLDVDPPPRDTIHFPPLGTPQGEAGGDPEPEPPRAPRPAPRDPRQAHGALQQDPRDPRQDPRIPRQDPPLSVPQWDAGEAQRANQRDPPPRDSQRDSGETQPKEVWTPSQEPPSSVPQPDAGEIRPEAPEAPRRDPPPSAPQWEAGETQPKVVWTPTQALLPRAPQSDAGETQTGSQRTLQRNPPSRDYQRDSDDSQSDLLSESEDDTSSDDQRSPPPTVRKLRRLRTETDPTILDEDEETAPTPTPTTSGPSSTQGRSRARLLATTSPTSATEEPLTTEEPLATSGDAPGDDTEWTVVSPRRTRRHSRQRSSSVSSCGSAAPPVRPQRANRGPRAAKLADSRDV